MPYYDEVIQHLQWAVLDIQRAGILVDTNLAKFYAEQASQGMQAIKEQFTRCLGYDLNPNAPQQVMQMFAQDFGIRLGESADALTLLKTTIEFPQTKPIVEQIINYRDFMKLKGTYLKPEPWPDGRVRSAFRTYGTLTWRLSSKEPDLQNLPRGVVQGINVKDLYMAPPGRVLYEEDYSALEDRIPAYASGCSKLIEMFEKGQNTHVYRAGIIFGRPITKKDPEYDFSKRLRYARGYGAAPPKISDKLLEDMHEWHPPSEIVPMLRRLDDDMPEILAWHNACWTEAERTGILRDGFGTPRILFEAPDNRRQVAYSWPVQATASGIMNRAMVRLYLNRHRLSPGTTIICQVHDSLLFEMDEDALERDRQVIRELMQEPVTVWDRKVVFPTEGKWGTRWGSMKAA